MTPVLIQGLLALGDYMNVQCHACIGGTNVGEDIRKLDYGQHVVAGTPGRVFGKHFVCNSRAVGSVCKTRSSDPALFSVCCAACWSVGVTCKKWTEVSEML